MQPRSLNIFSEVLSNAYREIDQFLHMQMHRSASIRANSVSMSVEDLFNSRRDCNVIIGLEPAVHNEQTHGQQWARSVDPNRQIFTWYWLTISDFLTEPDTMP